MGKEAVKEGLKKFVSTEMIDNVTKVVDDPQVYSLIMKGEPITLSIQIRIPKATVLKLREAMHE